MKIIDLSHDIYPGMPVFPGTEPPEFREANTLENSGFIETKITMYSHTGTHMDAPAHMLKDGKTLDQFPVEHFIGVGIILDFSKIQSQSIDIGDLSVYTREIEKADYLILKTGWSRFWGSDRYYEGFPALTAEAAMWLGNFKLKGIGIDTISIDRMDSAEFPVHHAFFREGRVIVENLANLDAVGSGRFIFSCMPLKTRGADGSPVRAAAVTGLG